MGKLSKESYLHGSKWHYKFTGTRRVMRHWITFQSSWYSAQCTVFTHFPLTSVLFKKNAFICSEKLEKEFWFYKKHWRIFGQNHPFYVNISHILKMYNQIDTEPSWGLHFVYIYGSRIIENCDCVSWYMLCTVVLVMYWLQVCCWLYFGFGYKKPKGVGWRLNDIQEFSWYGWVGSLFFWPRSGHFFSGPGQGGLAFSCLGPERASDFSRFLVDFWPIFWLGGNFWVSGWIGLPKICPGSSRA